jgi:hypothetical protein
MKAFSAVCETWGGLRVGPESYNENDSQIPVLPAADAIVGFGAQSG